MVTHDQDGSFDPPAEQMTRSWGTRYALAGTFRYGGVSGWHGFVYRRR
jgi:hypothetical protein